MLHKCNANANSGNKSSPSLFVSAKAQISANNTGAKPERNKMSRAVSPSTAFSPLATAVRNKCSNLVWSLAVMNDKRMFGILMSEFSWTSARAAEKPVFCAWSGA